MNYKLVVIDMDGTILTPDLEISEETITAVRKVIEMGVLVTLSTGRMYSAALPFAKLLQLDVPIITCNGAITKCSRTGEVYDIKTIPNQYSLEIINYCEQEDLSLSIYTDKEIYSKEPNCNLQIHREFDHADPKIIDDFLPHANGLLVKILFSCKDEKQLAAHARTLYQRYEGKVSFNFYLPHFVEIVHDNVTKKDALENLAKKSNIIREEILAIGDNLNDLEMIEYAGLGVAMGNAPKIVKEAADFVTRSNDEDGVRYVLEKFILNSD
jgi:Cof subfamily protein (haloacid dehalogenase superfamily)